MKNTFSISEAISFGWRTFKSNWKFWIVSFTLLGVVSGGSNVNLNNQLDLSKYMQDSSTNVTTVQTNTSTQVNQNLLNYLPFNNSDSNVLGATTETEDTPSAGVMVALLVLGLAYGIPLLATFLVFFIIATLLGTCIQMGFFNLLMDAARGKQVYYKTILNQMSLKKALKYNVAIFLVVLCVAFGFILLIIPGIYLALRLSFVPYLMIDGEGKIRESFSKSGELTKGIKLKLIGFGFVSFFVALLGLLAFGIGMVPASIVLSLAQVYVYVKMADGQVSSIQAPAETVPQTL